MADTGLIAIRGFKAGAIKFVATRGYVPNPSGSTLIACVTSRGYGIANTHLLALRGFCANPGSSGSGAYCIFGGSILTSTSGDGWL